MMHISSRRFSVLSCLISSALLVSPLSAYMYEGHEDLGNNEGPGGLLGDHFDQSQKCFSDYQFGSVQFVFDQEQIKITAGTTLEIRGTVRNTNDYPLGEGKILARVLREDNDVADKNWHPIVAEQTLPEDYSIAAKSDKSFVFQWDVPGKAPSGKYRVEFFYMAGNHTIFAGIPYVANVSGGSVLVTVDEHAAPQALTFDRSSVVLQGNGLELRAVPPVLSASEPVKGSVDLRSIGSEATSFHLKTALYSWSDTDGTPALLETNSDGTVAPDEAVSVPFEWNTPVAGVYQLVITATPNDTSILPSIIKIRFPIQGNAPRILYSGFGVFLPDHALVTTCVVNGTIGEGKGSVNTKVLANGVVVGDASTDSSSEMSVINLEIPRDKIAGAITIQSEARNEKGDVVDSQNVTYTPDLLPREPISVFWVVIPFIIAGLIALSIPVYYLMKKRNTL